MEFDRPGTPEDLPPLDTLWAHAAVAAALEVGAGGGYRLHRLEDGPVLYDDGGGNTWRLLRLEGGRGLLIGFDHECDDFVDDDEFDVFEDGPDWLPWDWMLDLETRENIGFVYWWDGTAWARTPYPEYVERDGVGWLLPHLFTAEDLTVWLTGKRFDLAGEEQRALLARRLPGVLRAAREGRLTGDDLGGVLGLLEGDTDLPAAVEGARRTGLVPGSSHPAVPAGGGRPPRPQILRAEGGFGHGDMLRGAREIPGRPEPAPGPELERLVAWVREHRLDGDGPAVLVHDAVAARWGRLPREERETEESVLCGALHEAETHPEHGGWLYLLLEVTADAHTVRRAYDHWPAWFTEHSGGPSARGFGDRSFDEWIRRRDERWRPAWLHRWQGLRTPSGPPPEWTRPGGPAPSYPWKRLSERERGSLLAELHGELAAAATGEWARIVLSCHSLLTGAGVLIRVVRPDGTGERMFAPPGLSAPLAGLRSGMYERGTGTWYRAELVFHRDGTREEAYDHDAEPEFGRRVGDDSYQLDFRYFPRDTAHTPN
ncbi:hypothetical protein CQJ94_26260 [Glycomyces fuscus]|nr:hypothetical protein CQJ94_26260 [Glycomyces fuscus]